MGEEEVARTIRAYLNDLLKKGMTLPMYVSYISVNGSMLYARYFQGDPGRVSSEILREYAPGDKMIQPVFALYVDGRGNAAAVNLRDPKTAFLQDMPDPKVRH